MSAYGRLRDIPSPALPSSGSTGVFSAARILAGQHPVSLANSVRAFTVFDFLVVHNLVVCNYSEVTDNLALDRQVCFALYSASRAMTARYRSMLDALGVTYPQYLVLLVLWEQDGRGVREICDALDLDTGTLSPLLKRLDILGLVERRRSSADERRVGIHLTEKGAGLRTAAEGIPTELARSTGMGVDELVALRDTLSRLTESLHSFETPTGEK